MVRRNKGHFVLFGFDKQEDKLKKSAVSIANDIRKAANGRMCGSCFHYSGLGCSKFKSIITDNNLICKESSVACRGYKEQITIVDTLSALDYFLNTTVVI